MIFGWGSRVKVNCLHGYFKFKERAVGQISDFISYYGFALELKDDYYTFATLKDAPEYSIAGNLYLGAPAIKTFEGKPWEVMKENKLVYDFTVDKVVPILSIVQPVQITSTDRYLLTSGMLLPGSLTDEGLRVTDYAAFYLFETIKFKYTEVGFGSDI
jgi:hypothetical protein